MKIKKVHIENFRNITFGYVDHLPDFVVIGGANGCGKTTFLEAIFTAKEAVAPYRGFPEPEKNIISTNADNAKILLELEFSEFDKRYAFDNLQIKCPDQAQLFVKFERDGNAITDCPHEVRDLLKKFKLGENAPGFFDYFNAHRRINKTNLSNITLNQSLDDVKRGLSQSEDKYNQTKEYLITLKIRNLLEIEKNLKGNPLTGNNLYEEIVQFFNDFFHPMIFKDIDLSCSPIRFNIETPNGEIELDDLSSGEKEIFHSFVRFHRFSKEGAIVLFDEPDLHLHPEIIKRYLYHLKKISIGNQFIITTHSPEIMLGSDITSLYTIQKTISPERHSQIYQVINDSKRFELLRNTVGSSGIISFNKRIIFIEGEDSSSDLAIYEAYYPPHKNNIKFVPAKNSLGIKQVSKKIEELLSSSIGFQQYYCIIDGDMETSLSDENGLSRLYRLPVYHVENFLVDESKIFNATQKLLREKNPYKEIKEIKEELKALILENSHLNQYTKVLLEADNQKVINDFQTLVYKNRNIQKFEYTLKSFEDIKKKGLGSNFAHLAKEMEKN